MDIPSRRVENFAEQMDTSGPPAAVDHADENVPPQRRLDHHLMPESREVCHAVVRLVYLNGASSASNGTSNKTESSATARSPSDSMDSGIALDSVMDTGVAVEDELDEDQRRDEDAWLSSDDEEEDDVDPMADRRRWFITRDEDGSLRLASSTTELPTSNAHRTAKAHRDSRGTESLASWQQKWRSSGWRYSSLGARTMSPPPKWQRSGSTRGAAPSGECNKNLVDSTEDGYGGGTTGS
ncbi:hypothetical protein AAVH_31604, partial [Aphelenchoides avenae]